MGRYDERGPLTTREAFALLTVEELKPLAALVGPVLKKKDELVDALARALTDLATVRDLYERLDDIGRKAVQEATHDPAGQLHDESAIVTWEARGCGPRCAG